MKEETWSVCRNHTFDWWYSWDVGILRKGLLHILPHIWFFPWNRKKAKAIADAINELSASSPVDKTPASGAASPARTKEFPHG